MCGLAGILSFSEEPVAPGQLESMIRPLHHRGPDDTQVFSQQEGGVGVGLAHARLSIIDIAGGRQPVHNEDQSIWTVFNGEIFNYLELRQELEPAAASVGVEPLHSPGHAARVHNGGALRQARVRPATTN